MKIELPEKRYYGIGEVAKFTTTDWNLISNDALIFRFQVQDPR